MSRPLDIVFFGLSLSSSWGNGHATTFRGLIRGLAAQGHRVTFFERDVPWYAGHRDLSDPDFCRLVLYEGLAQVLATHAEDLAAADAVIVGSYVPDGVRLIDALAQRRLKRLCFYDIDTPVTLAALERGEEEYLARRQIPLFDDYFSFSGGAVLERLEQVFGARRAEALYCSVDPARYAPTGEEVQWDLGYLGTYSPDRQPTLERLLIEPARRLPHRRFVVAGPQYPHTIRWPENVDRIEHLPPDEHAGFYSRQRFTLNVTRDDMRRAGWSPSVRLFEAAACGAAVLSDTWPGLGDILPIGKAILTPGSCEEVVDILESTDCDKHCKIVDTAREIVLTSHTGEVRAALLVEVLGQPRLPSPQVGGDETTKVEGRVT